MWKVIRLNNHGSKCMFVKKISTCILMYALFKPFNIIIDCVLRPVKNFLNNLVFCLYIWFFHEDQLKRFVPFDH